MPPIDLFSDTHTLPDAAMRRAMAEAEVGDEQMGEDPTTARLEAEVASLLGHERSLFLPTGSMCNKVAVAALTRPGDAVVCDHLAHLYRFEGGGPAALSGVVFEPLQTESGHFTVDQLEAVFNQGNVYQPRTALVSMEQTHNFAGGTVWPWEQYGAVAGATRTAGLSVFTDGARLLNAAAASGISADRWGAEVDAVWIDFSKGLGAPGGAAIAGSEEFITAANRFKYMLGGAMRQSGILAAACLHGLTHNVAGLADDHARARRLAAGLDGTGMAVESPQSNMVFFDPAPLGISPGDLVGRLATAGIRVSPVAGRIRAVTHLGVGDDDIDDAIAAIREQAGG